MSGSGEHGYECLVSTCRATLFATGSDRRRSFSCDSTCHEGLPKDGIIVGPQKRRGHFAASQTIAFLKAKENLTDHQAQERAHIGVCLPLLEEAWKLKETLSDWYATATAETAAEQLDRWIEEVQDQCVCPLKTAPDRFPTMEARNLGFFDVSHFQWLCGREKQSDQDDDETKLWLQKSSASALAILAGNLR